MKLTPGVWTASPRFSVYPFIAVGSQEYHTIRCFFGWPVFSRDRSLGEHVGVVERKRVVLRAADRCSGSLGLRASGRGPPAHRGPRGLLTVRGAGDNTAWLSPAQAQCRERFLFLGRHAQDCDHWAGFQRVFLVVSWGLFFGKLSHCCPGWRHRFTSPCVLRLHGECGCQQVLTAAAPLDEHRLSPTATSLKAGHRRPRAGVRSTCVPLVEELFLAPSPTF